MSEREIHTNEITYEVPQTAKHRISSKNGAFLFVAYGCALMERQTDGGAYVYTAVNYTSGKTEIVSRRNKKIGEGAFAGMAAKICELDISDGGRLLVQKKPGEKADSVSLTLIVNYLFTKILPRHGYVVRDRQIDLARHILGVTGRRGVTLAESEVGTGKTLAYLAAAVLAKRGRLNEFWLRGANPRESWAASAQMPVVISTSSIALQKAIIMDYIPELSRILMEHGIIKIPLTAVIRKGKEHFICEKRLKAFYDSTDARTKELLAPFIGKNAPFDLTDADCLSAYIKRHICVSGSCGKNCKYRGDCRYQQYLDKANDPSVDFLVTNHNYFLADVLHRAGDRRPLLPNYQLVIIDEAHKFLQAARSMYGLELTDTELPEIAREVHAFTVDKSGSGVNVHKLAKKLEDQSRKVFRRLIGNIPEPESDDEADRFTAVMDSDACRHMKSIAGIAADISEATASSYVQPLHKERKGKAIHKLNMLAERVSSLREQSKLIYWLEKRMEGETETTALCAIPKDLDARLYRDLWKNGVPVVLTSGTLSASGDFSRAKETLGLNHIPDRRLSDTSMTSPFDYRSNAMLYISENMPFPDNKDKKYITAVADEVERLAKASNGHAAVLFTSYNAMGLVYADLAKRGLPFPLFRMERGGTGAIEQFKNSGNGILFASGALWEGIDIPGDALSMLIIVRLPFPVPDPIGDYERSLCGDLETYKARAIVPDMIVKLKQGFGRLIRNETDTGVCAILDCRASERGAYRSRILAALPDCNVTSDIANIRRFIRQKKSPGYFTVHSKGGLS